MACWIAHCVLGEGGAFASEELTRAGEFSSDGLVSCTGVFSTARCFPFCFSDNVIVCSVGVVAAWNSLDISTEFKKFRMKLKSNVGNGSSRGSSNPVSELVWSVKDGGTSSAHLTLLTGGRGRSSSSSVGLACLTARPGEASSSRGWRLSTLLSSRSWTFRARFRPLSTDGALWLKSGVSESRGCFLGE